MHATLVEVLLIGKEDEGVGKRMKEPPGSWKCLYIYMTNNVVSVSGVQQSFSIIHIPVPILFQILFPLRLLLKTEQSSLCYTADSYWLSILNTVVCIHVSPNLSLPTLPPTPPRVTINSVSVYFYFVTKFICIIFFRFCISDVI